MKEPIRKVHTFSSLLLEQEGHLLSKKGIDFLTKINKSINRPDGLMDDIFELIRIHSYEISKQEVNLKNVVHEVRNELKDEIKITNTSFEIKGLRTINGF